MDKRLSRFGIGPKIVLATLAFTAVAGAATWRWPEACILRFLPPRVAYAAGTILLLYGVPLWLAGIVSVMRAYKRDELVTTGAFAICRHPVYGAWIALNGPALALFTRSWPVMLAPLVAYAVFKRGIRIEEIYLAKRFGPAYAEYRNRVNEILPIPRRGREAVSPGR